MGGTLSGRDCWGAKPQDNGINDDPGRVQEARRGRDGADAAVDLLVAGVPALFPVRSVAGCQAAQGLGMGDLELSLAGHFPGDGQALA